MVLARQLHRKMDADREREEDEYKARQKEARRKAHEEARQEGHQQGIELALRDERDKVSGESLEQALERLRRVQPVPDPE